MSDFCRVLLVDDDEELVELVSRYLRREGFEVETARDGKSGLVQALSGQADLMLLDVMLPGLSGFEVLRRLRATTDARSHLPVLMLTARGAEADRVLGLESGADDYLAKPFSSRELVARIRAILRRGAAPTGGVTAFHDEIWCIGDLEIERGARAVRRSGQRIELTAVEFDLLEMLVRAGGEVVSRDRIARGVLARPLSNCDRSVDVHISNLRKKLGPAADGTERIKAVRFVGYIYLRPAALSSQNQNQSAPACQAVETT